MSLKDARKPFRVQWKVLATCKPSDNMSKKCNLCLKEKFFIICRNDLCTLNKRNELASSYIYIYICSKIAIIESNALKKKTTENGLYNYCSLSFAIAIK